eukprot:5449940-Pyramimonas_sp.AAC.1
MVSNPMGPQHGAPTVTFPRRFLGPLGCDLATDGTAQGRERAARGYDRALRSTFESRYQLLDMPARWRAEAVSS